MEPGRDNESVLAWAAATVAEQAKKVGGAIKTDLTKGSGPAIGREAINNVRGTIHQVFFGQAEGVGEPGTPMNPLQSEVAEQRRADDPPKDGQKAKGTGSPYGKDGVHGAADKPSRLPSPSEIAQEKQLYQPPPPDRGHGQDNSKGRE